MVAHHSLTEGFNLRSLAFHRRKVARARALKSPVTNLSLAMKNHSPSSKSFNRFDLLLRGCNVNINLRLLTAKYTGSIRKERGHQHDNKYHQDSNHARAAASSIAVVAH
jgi:hypothetical protein